MEAAIRAMGGNVNSRFGPNNQTMLHAVILDDENTDKQTSDLVESSKYMDPSAAHAGLGARRARGGAREEGWRAAACHSH